jgi:predicted nucleotidyltransferase
MNAERLAAVAHRHGIRLLLQFGSTVSGGAHARSDVDLAVLLERRPGSLDAQLELLADVASLVPGAEADVAVINGADPLFLKQVTERCQLLCGSERALHELRIYAWKRYQDHRRFLAMERECVDRKTRALSR